jgi:hypothetical protein
MMRNAQNKGGPMRIIYKQSDRIKEAYENGNAEIKKALRTLFPKLLDDVKIVAGQIYNWGTDPDGGSGLVVKRTSGRFDFVNFRTGETYLEDIQPDTTKTGLVHFLNKLNNIGTWHLHHCWTGELQGPKTMSSWCTKDWRTRKPKKGRTNL